MEQALPGGGIKRKDKEEEDGGTATVPKKLFRIPSPEEVARKSTSSTPATAVPKAFQATGLLKNFLNKTPLPQHQPIRPPDAPPGPPVPSATSTAAIGASSSEASSTYFAGSSSSAPSTSSTNASQFVGASTAASTTSPASTSHPIVPVVVSGGPRRGILVNNCQKGNRVLKYVKSVACDFSQVVPDFVLGANTAALFLSLKYYLLFPDYIYKRAGQMKNQPYKVRLLLIIVDVENSTKPLQELTKFSLIDGWTIILAWSNQEAARYLETYKLYEHKSPDSIKERAKEDFQGRMQDTLTQVRGVNKTDVQQLMENFGTLKGIMAGSMEELSLCPGLGEKKVKRLYNTIHCPFIKPSSQGSPVKGPPPQASTSTAISFDLQKRKKSRTDADSGDEEE